MSVKITGIADVDRVIARVDRKITRERQAHIRKAANKTLVPAMRSRATASPGKAGPLLAKAVSARNGKHGAVIVGPRGGKRGAWWRHIFIGGAQGHIVGARSRKRVLYNPAGPFISGRPVRHPGIPANPFVNNGSEAASRAFTDAVASALFTDRKES